MGSIKHCILLALVIIGLWYTSTVHKHNGVAYQYHRPTVGTTSSNSKPVFLKYLGTRMVYYPNSVSTFQSQLLVAGDIELNPGPDETNSVLLDDRNRPTHTVYSTAELLNANSENASVPLNTWLNIRSLGIQAKAPTHRGVRAGVRKQRRRSSVSSTACPQPTDVLTNSNSLSICQWNARSVGNKTTTCSDYVLDNNIDALFLTETWMSELDNVKIGELCPPGYNFINIPRDYNKCGGLGILYRSPLKFQIIPFDFKTVNFEYSIISNNERKIYYVVIYRPPPSKENQLKTSNFLVDFEVFVMCVNSLAGKIIMLGDYNIHCNRPEKSEVARFLEILKSTGFHQYAKGPTHISGNTIDLVIARPEENLIKECSVGVRLSDHHMVHCKLSLQKPSEQQNVSVTRNFRNIDTINFQKDLNSCFVDILTRDDNVDYLSVAFEESIIKSLDLYAPVSKKTRSTRLRQPWYNSDIHSARRIRRTCEKKWRKTRLEVHHDMYIEQNKEVNKLIDRAKKQHISEKLNSAHDSKSVYKIVNGLLNNSSKVLPAYECANTLSNSFATYYQDKVSIIYSDLDKQQSGSVCSDTYRVNVTCRLSKFNQVSEEDVIKLVNGTATKGCVLDPVPTWFLKENVSIYVPVITHIINMSLSTGVFPDTFKHAIINPLIKKQSLNPEELKNYRPVANIKFMSKLIENMSSIL
ncbi:uncharacterized protein [Amphiura filiformis]|uniref:uncharacterized protein n=1 Tax=Amphiura filiformis TaxID=82378 RepID=UPI003B2241F1